MSPVELWWHIEAGQPVKMYGNQTEDEVRDIYEETYGPFQPKD
jgi:hypothetical protein